MTKKLGVFALCIWILGLSTACSQLDLPFSKDDQTAQEEAAKTPGSTSNPGAPGSLPTPNVAPPSFDDRPPKPGQLPKQETLPNGLPALKPLKGVNVDKLFSENISDSGQRFNRLENAVTDLRKEFEVAKPAIVRLVAVENDIQNLIEQLELLAQEEAQRPAIIEKEPVQTQQPTQNTANVQPTDLRPPDAIKQAQAAPNQQATQAAAPPVPKAPAAPKPKSQPPPKVVSGAMLGNIRMSDHAGKARLVLETGQKLAYTADIDNEENLLILTFPKGKIGFDVNRIRKTSKLIKSISATPQGDGFILAFTLSKPSSILLKGQIAPNKDNPNHRIFMDLKR